MTAAANDLAFLTQVGEFDAGNVVLQSGRTFRNMRLVYKTFGTLNAERSNRHSLPHVV